MASMVGSVSPPLILTLCFDQATFELFNRLRTQHFPQGRNMVPAHATLFHALPGDHEVAIRQALQELCAATQTIDIAFPRPRFLGRGVAIDVESAALQQLRATLAHLWHEWLGAQDRQRYRPHITIQNKVATETARQLYQQFDNTWQHITGQGTGLTLWYYRGGPWQQAATFPFQDTAPNDG